MVKYNQHPDILNRVSDFEVKLGVGLHLGYAIEGAIGSLYKIDASYLSSDVGLSDKLEAATKTYGVGMLMSGSLVKHCSKATQHYCR